ncbi:hypothetical protein niasHS_001511 [Heterodera schachtii]|uniref:Uncharacterized protein n=1 Tax=Heterodera schachtii TaxID=97005 RepID=A0ABD2KDY4_HETSC
MGCCGPKVVAVISCVLNIIGAILFFIGYGLKESRTESIWVGLFCLVLAFSCFAIIFAGDNASLFLPFLVLDFPALLLDAYLFLRVLLALILEHKSSFWHEMNEPSPIDVTVKLIIMLVISLIVTALFAWFYSIIFRAYVELAEKSAPDNANSEGYGDVAAGPTCCCGPCRARIETAIPVVALIGFLCQLFVAVVYFYHYGQCDYVDYCFAFILLGPVCLAAAIAYLVVVFAQRERNPSLFLPYLFIMPVQLLITLSLCVWLLVIREKILGPQILPHRGGFAFTIILVDDYIMMLFTELFPLVFHSWFYSLIFRAYKKTKQQKSASFVANSSSRAEESRVGP